VTPFETRENYSEKLYRPDGFRRSYRWKRCRRDAWRRLVLTRGQLARNDAQLIVMTAELELPFDRYWSKN